METAQRGFGSQSHSKVQLTLVIPFKCDALRLVLRVRGHRSVPNMIAWDHTGQGRGGCRLGEPEVKVQVEVLSVESGGIRLREAPILRSLGLGAQRHRRTLTLLRLRALPARRSGKHGQPRDKRNGAQKIFSSQTSQLPNPKSGPFQFRLFKQSPNQLCHTDREVTPLERNSGEAGRLFRTSLPSALGQVFPLGGALVPVHKTASALISSNHPSRPKPHTDGLRGSVSADLV